MKNRKVQKGIKAVAASLAVVFGLLASPDLAQAAPLNGIYQNEMSQWVYYSNGAVDWRFTGLASNEFGWWYVEDGIVDFSFTGLVENEVGIWYVQGGGIDFNYTNVVFCNDEWVYVKNGLWQENYTGLADNEFGWWYVEDGVVDFSHTGLVENEAGIWYVQGGGIDFSYSSVIQDGSQWVFVKNAELQENYTGLASNEFGWWYLKNGAADFSYTGLAANEVGTWYVQGGGIDFGYTNVVLLADGSRVYIQNGQLQENYTGLVENDEALWYISNGRVNQNYKGFEKNEAGRWHINNGKVDGAVGIDVSSYQGKIDWNAVKADGIQYALIRIGIGDDEAEQDDKTALYNMQECERLGIPYGVYLVTYAMSDEQANSEASHIFRMLQGRKPSMGVYVDVEVTEYYNRYGLDPYSEEGRTSITRWTNIVLNRLNGSFETGVYANLDYFSNVLYKEQLNCRKWLAIYGREDIPEGDWEMWQYTSSGSVNGITGNVDMNIWYGWNR